jgi:hypothetical protein
VCNHLNLKILIRIFTVIYLIMIIIIMRGEKFVAHLDGLGGTPVCRAEHQLRITVPQDRNVLGLKFAAPLALWKSGL